MIYIVQVAGSDDLSDAHDVRRQVFLVEQGIAGEAEFDATDEAAQHLVAYDSDKPVGTARIRIVDSKAKLERFAVLKEYRDQDIGRLLMETLLALAKQENLSEAYLMSQTYAVPFYTKFGFATEGNEFQQAGLPHINRCYERLSFPVKVTSSRESLRHVAAPPIYGVVKETSV